MVSEANVKTITLGTTNLCASLDEQKPDYVFFTGSIAGISDSPASEGNADALKRRSDEVQLDRKGVDGV